MREEWAHEYGLSQFISEEFQNSVEKVCERINVHSDNIKLNAPNSELMKSITKLGGTIQIAPQNTVGEHNCGWCAFGCRYGEKQGTVRTWLMDAAANGAKFLQNATVDKVLVDNGRAAGVVGNTGDGHSFKIKAPIVIVSGGSLNTPNLLRRSGLTNHHIGTNLRLHLASGVVGVFEEIKNSHMGGIMTTVSNDLANIHGDHYGVKLEVPTVHPGLMSAILPFEGAASHRARMLDFSKTIAIVVLTRDKG